MKSSAKPSDKMDKLKKTVEILKAKIAKVQGPPETLRGFRHGLKRAQRRLAELMPLTLEDKLKRTEKLLETVTKRAEVLKKQGKKAIDPYAHSVNKSLKSLNKKLRKLKRIQEKAKKAEEKAAKRAAPPETKPESTPPS